MQGKSTQPTDVEVAWAAGLFEGEGCFGIYARGSRPNSVNVQLRLAMTDRDAVERFAAIVNIPVNGPRTRRTNEKPLWECVTQHRGECKRIAAMLLPHLCERRAAKAQEILDLPDTKSLGERTHCPKGHPYSGDNLIIEMVGPKGAQHVARRCKTCRTIQSRERARKRLGVKPENYRIKELP